MLPSQRSDGGSIPPESTTRDRSNTLAPLVEQQGTRLQPASSPVQLREGAPRTPRETRAPSAPAPGREPGVRNPARWFDSTRWHLVTSSRSSSATPRRRATRDDARAPARCDERVASTRHLTRHRAGRVVWVSRLTPSACAAGVPSRRASRIHRLASDDVAGADIVAQRRVPQHRVALTSPWSIISISNAR